MEPTNAPIGQVDTPVQNQAGVVGAIGVTGWVVDDFDVTGVKIYRNCLDAIDRPKGACRPVTSGFPDLVFIGDAAFLAGARPDVEAAFPGYPFAYRAGWGYLLLTNMLPHVAGGLPYGGQGAVTLYAFAAGARGVALLGRSQTDQTPTTITLNNDAIAKPFGAIDTPGQGADGVGRGPQFRVGADTRQQHDGGG